jgi:hypothetical protein
MASASVVTSDGVDEELEVLVGAVTVGDGQGRGREVQRITSHPRLTVWT